MRGNNRSLDNVKRRGYLKGIAAAGITAGAVSRVPDVANAVSGDTVRANGDNVYLIFGVDTSSTDLESWLADHKSDVHSSSQKSSSDVIQYQDVSQLNVNQQQKAVAISIDGGNASAIQRTYQHNKNQQMGKAWSINASAEEKQRTFTDLKDVYIVFAHETESRDFSGWVVSGHEYESEQNAEAEIDQEQDVEQANISSQNFAIALAEDSSYARSYQRSFQINKNVQDAEALAANVGNGDDQNADSSVDQSQEVDQLNYNQQGVAVAVAVGETSKAKAWQVSCQFNRNQQIASAAALNFDPKLVDEFMATANMTGDYSDSDVKRGSDGSAQANEQGAESNIDQFQAVSQLNRSSQKAAVAIALSNSESKATQASYQGNFNAQIASATSVNVDDGWYKLDGVTKGTDAKGDGSWAVAYDNGGKQVNEQTALSDVEQEQYIRQLNVNEQNSAVAFSANDGTATAEQLNYQRNENVQYAESNSGNKGDQGDDCEDGKKRHHHDDDDCRDGKKHHHKHKHHKKCD
ncbi:MULTISPECIES: hypothetical protein [unclassified Haladaptatus]|uniref:hypothetical protein n=1 Tax=unclassified Haladaptatus TaxID=2622732 RepID=UPI00209C2D1E|nr:MULTISPECIES: hypothetical protein [unclassified Haladaptatus]MCO8242831.1 hypothetical protein [Haladaptatus sp. AB643]MCO8252591.1 hypothetical protein [Haladaptatus sp. AB618]